MHFFGFFKISSNEEEEVLELMEVWFGADFYSFVDGC